MLGLEGEQSRSTHPSQDRRGGCPGRFGLAFVLNRESLSDEDSRREVTFAFGTLKDCGQDHLCGQLEGTGAEQPDTMVQSCLPLKSR